MYCHIGERINREILKDKRAEYGKNIVGMLFERTAIATKPAELIRQELADLRDDNKLSPVMTIKKATAVAEGLKRKWEGIGAWIIWLS